MCVDAAFLFGGIPLPIRPDIGARRFKPRVSEETDHRGGSGVLSRALRRYPTTHNVPLSDRRLCVIVRRLRQAIPAMLKRRYGVVSCRGRSLMRTRPAAPLMECHEPDPWRSARDAGRRAKDAPDFVARLPLALAPYHREVRRITLEVVGPKDEHWTKNPGALLHPGRSACIPLTDGCHRTSSITTPRLKTGSGGATPLEIGRALSGWDVSFKPG